MQDDTPDKTPDVNGDAVGAREPVPTLPVEQGVNMTPEVEVRPETTPDDPAESITEPVTEPVAPTSSVSADAPVISDVRPAPAPVATPVANPFPTTTPVVAAVGAKAPKTKKKWLVPAIIAVVVVALGGGGYAAYSWYESPQKVVNDALASLVQADTLKSKMTMTISSNNELEVGLTIDGQNSKSQTAATATIKVTGKGDYSALGTVTVGADMVQDSDGTYYFKANDLKSSYNSVRDAYVTYMKNYYESMGYDVTDSALSSVKSNLDSSFSPVITELDGQWIKVTASELDSYNSSSSASDNKDVTCVTDAFTKARNDKALTKEVVDAYTKNAFITAGDKLGSKDGSYGYKLSLDSDKAKAFSTAVKETTLGKDIAACNINTSSTSGSTSNDNPFSDVSAEVWVNPWTHKMTKFSMSGKDTSKVDFSVDMTTDVNAKTSIDIPSNAKSFEDVKNDLENITKVLSA